MIVTILSFIIVLGILVFVHELGHFLAAKMFKMRVDRFSLGFPPRAFGKKYGGTDYCISWIPLGGYVKIAGMIDESMDKEHLEQEPQPWEFRSKPVWQRIIVISAGVIMNMLLAVVVFSIVTFNTGIPEAVGDLPVVGSLVEELPAKSAGLQEGDQIVAINDQPIETWNDMTKIIHNSPNTTLSIEWIRGKEHFSAEITTVEQEMQINEEIKKVGLIGISQQITYRKISLGESIKYGFLITYNMTGQILNFLKGMITGKYSVRENVGGPIAIAQMTGTVVKKFGWNALWQFMAALSINLAFLNILPIPALDGGHLLFLIIEGIIRRPVSDKIRLVFQQVGMALLLLLMVFILFNDVSRLIQ